ncbi:MAG: hypothetical protein N2A99_06500 [Carnobacterium alterfunditum]
MKIFKRLFKKEIELEMGNLQKKKSEFLGDESEFEELPIVESVQKELSEDEMIKKRIAEFKLGETEILGIERNKKGEELYVVKCTSGEKIDIYLFGKEYYPDNMLPKIHAYFKTDDFGEKHIFIEQMEAVKKRSRNGEIAIDYMLDLAKQHDVSYVSGELKYADRKNFDGLKSFYYVMGFDVEVNATETYGTLKQSVKDIDRNRDKRNEKKEELRKASKERDKPVRTMQDLER